MKNLHFHYIHSISAVYIYVYFFSFFSVKNEIFYLVKIKKNGTKNKGQEKMKL